MDLVIVDVDGTLVDTRGVDETCLAHACGAVLGVPDVAAVRTAHAERTNSGLAALVAEHRHRHVDGDTVERVRQEYCIRVEAAYTAMPERFTAAAGAADILPRMRQAGYAVALMSTSWHDSARFTLRVAGVATDGIPMATADDGYRRTDVVLRAVERVRDWAMLTVDGRVTVVTDAEATVVAARSLGHGTVGVGAAAERLLAAGADSVVADMAGVADLFRLPE